MFTAATAAVAAAAIQQNEAPFYCGNTVVDGENTTKLYELLLDTSVPSTVEWMRPVIYFTLVNKTALLLQSHVNMINSYAIITEELTPCN